MNSNKQIWIECIQKKHSEEGIKCGKKRQLQIKCNNNKNEKGINGKKETRRKGKRQGGKENGESKDVP